MGLLSSLGGRAGQGWAGKLGLSSHWMGLCCPLLGEMPLGECPLQAQVVSKRKRNRARSWEHVHTFPDPYIRKFIRSCEIRALSPAELLL